MKGITEDHSLSKEFNYAKKIYEKTLLEFFEF